MANVVFTKGVHDNLIEACIGLKTAIQDNKVSFYFDGKRGLKVCPYLALKYDLQIVDEWGKELDLTSDEDIKHLLDILVSWKKGTHTFFINLGFYKKFEVKVLK